jgi:hypothetical protein
METISIEAMIIILQLEGDRILVDNSLRLTLRSLVWPQNQYELEIVVLNGQL